MLVLAGGAVIGLLVALVAIAGVSSVAPSAGNDESTGALLAYALQESKDLDAPVAVIDIDHGDHCHFISISCGGVSVASSVAAAVPAGATVSDSSALVRFDIPPFTSIPDVLLSNTTPPPRSA